MKILRKITAKTVAPDLLAEFPAYEGPIFSVVGFATGKESHTLNLMPEEAPAMDRNLGKKGGIRKVGRRDDAAIRCQTARDAVPERRGRGRRLLSLFHSTDVIIGRR